MMTIDELNGENMAIRHMIYDLERQVKEYKAWLVKNDCLIADELEKMSAEVKR